MKIKRYFTFIAAATIVAGMASCGQKTESAAEGEEAQAVEVEATALPSEEAVAVEAPVDSTASEYITTPSGLKYKVIKQGTGVKPKATDVVKVNYEGRLTNGQVFDSSYQRNQPAVFPLNRVIEGWTEGLQLMPEGSTYELYIPYNLAYKEAGAPGIPPKSDLIFVVELLEVQK